MRTALIVFFFVVQTLVGDTNKRPLFKLSEILPNGHCELELMTVRFSDRANELALKLQVAVTSHKEWLLEHIKRSKPGEPLVYDQRFGLTKEEYAEYLKEIEKRYLAPLGTRLPCTFRRQGDMLTLDIGDSKSPLSKIRLNIVTGELLASVGKVGMPTWASSNSPHSAIGAYDSCSWKYEKGDLETFDLRLVKLEIFRLKTSGKILWRFKDSEMVHKEKKSSFEVLFQHSPGGPPPNGGVNGNPPIRRK